MSKSRKDDLNQPLLEDGLSEKAVKKVQQDVNDAIVHLVRFCKEELLLQGKMKRSIFGNRNNASSTGTFNMLRNYRRKFNNSLNTYLKQKDTVPFPGLKATLDKFVEHLTAFQKRSMLKAIKPQIEELISDANGFKEQLGLESKEEYKSPGPAR